MTMHLTPKEENSFLSRPTNVSLWEATCYWFVLGFISFGGPAGQISLMHQQLVEQKKWISEKRFLHALNYCMLLPGPEAQQLATYIGWLMHRTWGGLIAGGLFVLPSFLLMVFLAFTYTNYGHLPAVSGFFAGIKPVVLGLVVFSAYRLGKKTLSNKFLWGLALLAFSAITFLHTPFPIIVLGAALCGFAHQYYQQLRASSVAHFVTKDASQLHALNSPLEKVAALIDDDSPIPAHAQFKWFNSIVILLVGVMLMLVIWGICLYWSPADSVMMKSVIFFTKAALLTFGGAYAVLPYIYQGMVDHFHWLSPAQVIDGLALGESTPGPLIMVITFLAFLAGVSDSLIDPSNRMAYAFAVATVATFVTFLPSFVFIFVGGPLIETTRTRPRMHAPLTAISAAIVGVIASLAVFLATHMFWPLGIQQSPQYLTIIFTVISFIFLKMGKINTVYLILLAGLGNAAVGYVVG